MGSLAYLVLLVSVSLPCFVVCQNDYDGDYSSETDPPFEQIYQGCENKVMDIYFILDSSTSIWVRHYETLHPFVRDIVSRLDIGQSKTRVGAVSYSNRLNSQPLRLNRFNDKNSIRSYISLDNFPYQRGITNTFEAIRFVRENQEFRQDITKVIVVITDGFSSDPEQTAREAELAREEGFYLFVIGLGLYPDEAEWMNIADDPDRDFIQNATSFMFTDYMKDWVAERACSLRPKPPAGVCRLANNAFASVYYISGSTGALNAAYMVSNQFGERTSGDRRDIRLSYFFQNCNRLNLPFGKTDDYCSRSRQSSQTQLSALIAGAKSAAMEARSDRGDHSQVALIFLDDAGAQALSEMLIQDLQEDGIEVILLDMSNRGSGNYLRNTLREPDNYIRLVSQEATGRAVAERMCAAIHRFNPGVFIPPN